MAIQLKGLEYFSLDVDFFENEKIAIIISDFGFEASAVIIKLLSRIYKNGFYLKWDEKACKIFTNSFRCRYRSTDIQQIVDTLVEEAFFDSRMYEEYGILTSRTIQQCFFMAIRRRQNKHVEHGEFLLVDLGEKENCRQNAGSSRTNVVKKTENVCKNGKNDDNSEQSKVKESRVNMYYYPSSTPQNENSQDSKDVPVGFAALARRFQSELLHDEEWCYSLCQTSGKGSAVLNLLPDIFPVFDAHIIATGDTGTITRLGDYKRRLLNWWRCMRFESAQEIRERSQPPAENTGRGKRNPPVSKVDEALSAAEEAATMACEILNRA